MTILQIEEQLSAAEHFDEELIKRNRCPEFKQLAAQYMSQRGVTRSRLIENMGVDKNYGYQLLNGTRMPTRDHIIHMGFLLELDTVRLQRLLLSAGKKPLYVRDVRDAKIFYALKHKMRYKEAMEFIGG